MKYEVTTLSDQLLSVGAETLTSAFMDDPLQVYTFPDEDERRQKSLLQFEIFLRFGLQYGQVYTTPAGEGMMVLLRPGETDVTPEKAEQGGLNGLPDVMGEDAAGRFFSVLGFLEPFHKLDAPEPHWYVMVVGVNKGDQGKGVGKALLQKLLHRARLMQQSVYLETAQPSNVPFYTGLGFRVLRELVEPESKLPLWTFKFTP